MKYKNGNMSKTLAQNQRFKNINCSFYYQRNCVLRLMFSLWSAYFLIFDQSAGGRGSEKEKKKLTNQIKLLKLSTFIKKQLPQFSFPCTYEKNGKRKKMKRRRKKNQIKHTNSNANNNNRFSHSTFPSWPAI